MRVPDFGDYFKITTFLSVLLTMNITIESNESDCLHMHIRISHYLNSEVQ